MENQTQAQSSTFLEKELELILKDSKKNQSTVLKQVLACTYIAAYNKAHDLKILDTTQVTSLGDYFALITVDNVPAALGLSDQILYHMKKLGLHLISREGNKETDWILMDYGDFVIHIFIGVARARYDLDELWINAPRIEIPQEFFLHGINNQNVLNQNNSKNSDIEDYL